MKIDLPEVLPALMADPNQLELAILNVCLNARDAMPNGGTLTISADCDVGTEGPQIALRITDTGTGIPPDLLPRIFEPFFTTKEVGKGSGLGLSQVYGFVKETGGSVDVESTVGSGTTVSIRLPVAGDYSEASEAHSSAPSRDLPENRARRGTILMVEDDLRVGELTKMLFEDNDYTVKPSTLPPTPWTCCAITVRWTWCSPTSSCPAASMDGNWPGSSGRSFHSCRSS